MKIALMGITGLLATQFVFAAPTIYPKDKTYLSALENKTNSNLVADTDDPRNFWVMPPNTGKSEVSGLYAITSNVGFCKEMRDLQSFSRSTVARMNDLAARSNEFNDQIMQKRERLNLAEVELAQFATENNLIELTYIDDRVAIIEDTMATLTESLRDCDEDCQEISRQLRELSAEKRTELTRRRSIVRTSRILARRYEKRKSKVDAIAADLDRMIDLDTKLRSRLVDIKNTFMDLYKSYRSMEGARATLSFTNNWEKNLLALREANPNFSFQKIPTQKAVITSSLAGVNGIPATGAILNYSMGRNFDDGRLELPAYPEENSGIVTLSLVGTCPMLHPEYFDINQENPSESMKYGLTVSYEYPTTMSVDAEASYNMYKMYQKVISSRKRGGFFSSRTTTSIDERTYFRDSFKVTWNEQSEAVSISDEEKRQIEKEWRNTIFARLATVGLPAAVNAGNLVLPQVPMNGATLLGRSLANNNFCKVNIYCSGASVGLEVLGAIFGSSKATTSYRNIQDVEMKERWSQTKVIYKPWISTYQ